MQQYAVAGVHVVLSYLLLHSSVEAAQQMGHDYIVTFDDEEIFSKCPEYPDNFLSNLVDLSEQTYELLENETIYVKGPMKVLYYPQESKLPFRFQLLKKDRGQWVSTIYNGNRPDFCESLMSSMEVWHMVFENIPKEHRQCPFKINSVIRLDRAIQMRLTNIQDKYMAGEYKVNVVSTLKKDDKAFFCFNGMIHLYKV